MKILKYILLISSFVVACMNLLDCFVKGSSPFRYIFYVLTLLLIAGSYTFIHSNKVIPVTLLIMGILTMVDHPPNGSLSGAIALLLFEINMFHKLWITISTYILTILIVMTTYIIAKQSAADALNMLIGYGVIYAINHTVFYGRWVLRE